MTTVQGRVLGGGPLESPAVAGGAVAIQGSDIARQDALNGAPIKVCEGLMGQAKFLLPPEFEEALLRLLCGWTISDFQ